MLEGNEALLACTRHIENVLQFQEEQPQSFNDSFVQVFILLKDSHSFHYQQSHFLHWFGFGIHDKQRS